ncbi:MAG: hypothetical protein JWM19_2227 [Actinomycetia bacterium]|nr:hypothetical protein [Actinomycetes bacterium]
MTAHRGGRSHQQSSITATVTIAVKSASDPTVCSICSSHTSNSDGIAGIVAPHHGRPRCRSTA